MRKSWDYGHQGDATLDGDLVSVRWSFPPFSEGKSSNKVENFEFSRLGVSRSNDLMIEVHGIFRKHVV